MYGLVLEKEEKNRRKSRKLIEVIIDQLYSIYRNFYINR